MSGRENMSNGDGNHKFRKYRYQLSDFPEKLFLELPIWRDFGLTSKFVLFKRLVNLRITEVDHALLQDDDAFVVADEEEDEDIEESDEDDWVSGSETDEESGYDTDDLCEDD